MIRVRLGRHAQQLAQSMDAMSDLSAAQFEGVGEIVQASHHGKSGGGFSLANVGLELGIDENRKLKLQAWGTNAQSVSERLNRRRSSTAEQPREREPQKPRRGVRMPPRAGGSSA